MKYINKQTIAAFTLGAVIFSGVGAGAAGLLNARYGDDVGIWLDNKPLKSKVVTVEENGQAKNYTAIRDIAEALGAKVTWRSSDNLIIIDSAKEGTVQDVAKQADNCVLLNCFKDNSLVATASGVLWGTDYILTNKHVLTGANKWTATGNTDTVGNYYGTDTKTFDDNLDIALIKTNRPHSSTIKIGDSDKVKVGDKVVVISSPRGTKNVVSEGIISKISDENGYRKIIVNAISAPGSSGGGIFNMKGELIGINYAGYDEKDNLVWGIGINNIAKVIK